jgi:hypothetical protein
MNTFEEMTDMLESAHFKENTLSHPNLSVKFCPVAYHLRSEMGHTFLFECHVSTDKPFY